MQILLIAHSCLYFKFNAKRYLYGMTHTLDCDSQLHQLDLDYVVIPTHPYSLDFNVYLWQCQFLRRYPDITVIVTDNRVTNVFQHNAATESILIRKWQLFRFTEFNEQTLIAAIKSRRTVPLERIAHIYHPAFNRSSEFLSIVAFEQSKMIALINQCDTLLIDPSENIGEIFLNQRIPIKSVCAVLLTNADNMNFVELLFKLNFLILILEQSVEKKIKHKLRTIFCFNEPMIQAALATRIIAVTNFKYRFRFLSIILQEFVSQQTTIRCWQIHFCSKIIRVYDQPLGHYPRQLHDLAGLELVVVWKMNQAIKKTLQQLPVLYRKKILYNRFHNKFQNKLFVSLSRECNWVTIEADKLLRHTVKNAGLRLCEKYFSKDIYASLTCKVLKDKEIVNCVDRIIKVTSGCLLDEDNQKHQTGELISGKKQLACIQNAVIMIWTKKQQFFFSRYQQILHEELIQDEEVLTKVLSNSFVKSVCFLSSTSSICQDKVNSPWKMLNKICNLKHYESGMLLNKHNKHVYIVVQGELQLQNNKNLVARKNMFLGFVAQYYQGLQQKQPDEEAQTTIQVIKETVVIQISLQDLDKQFLRNYPAKMYQLCCLPVAFQ